LSTPSFAVSELQGHYSLLPADEYKTAAVVRKATAKIEDCLALQPLGDRNQHKKAWIRPMNDSSVFAAHQSPPADPTPQEQEVLPADGYHSYPARY
jgi:hypothetical protein